MSGSRGAWWRRVALALLTACLCVSLWSCGDSGPVGRWRVIETRSHGDGSVQVLVRASKDERCYMLRITRAKESAQRSGRLALEGCVGRGVVASAADEPVVELAYGLQSGQVGFLGLLPGKGYEIRAEFADGGTASVVSAVPGVFGLVYDNGRVVTRYVVLDERREGVAMCTFVQKDLEVRCEPVDPAA